MPVGFKVLVHSRFLITVLGWISLRRIQNIGTPIVVRFFHALDVIRNVIFEESKG